MGKMTQSFSRHSDVRATKPLELVHCDLCGPIQPVAKDGFKYAISFVDDFSSATTVYFLRQKTDAVQATEKFLADCTRKIRLNVWERTTAQNLLMLNSDL